MKLEEFQRLLNSSMGPDGETWLDLSSKSFDSTYMQALVAAIQNKNCQLLGFNLYESGIEEAGCKTLAAALQHPHCGLKVIDLGMNSIGDSGAQALASSLQNENCQLIELHLGGNKIGRTGLQALAMALQSKHSQLEVLGLSHNNIQPGDIQALVPALKCKHSQLEVLDLCHNNIQPGDIQALVPALTCEHSQLRELMLTQNRIGAAGAQTLAQALQSKNNQLVKLDLNSSDIEDAGACTLATALQNPHCQLKELELAANNIGDMGPKALVLALQNEHCQLKGLNLNANKISPENMVSLISALQCEHNQLERFDFIGNKGTLKGVSELIDAIDNKNLRLTKIDFSFFNIRLGTDNERKLAAGLFSRRMNGYSNININIDSSHRLFHQSWKELTFFRNAVLTLLQWKRTPPQPGKTALNASGIFMTIASFLEPFPTTHLNLVLDKADRDRREVRMRLDQTMRLSQIVACDSLSSLQKTIQATVSSLPSVDPETALPEMTPETEQALVEKTGGLLLAQAEADVATSIEDAEAAGNKLQADALKISAKTRLTPTMSNFILMAVRLRMGGRFLNPYLAALKTIIDNNTTLPASLIVSALQHSTALMIPVSKRLNIFKPDAPTTTFSILVENLPVVGRHTRRKSIADDTNRFHGGGGGGGRK